MRDIGIASCSRGNHHPAMGRITPIRRKHRPAHDLQPDGTAGQSGAGHAPADRHRAARLCCRSMPKRWRSSAPRRALVVSGDEGLDELSGAGAEHRGERRLRVAMPARIAPEDAGLPRHPIAAIRGGDPDVQCRGAARACCSGEHGAYRDAVLLNAAAALIVAGAARDLGRRCRGSGRSDRQWRLPMRCSIAGSPIHDRHARPHPAKPSATRSPRARRPRRSPNSTRASRGRRAPRGFRAALDAKARDRLRA